MFFYPSYGMVSMEKCKNENLAEMNLENIVRHKGYKSLEEAEKRNISGSDDS